jgi:hypothetical protein
MADYHDRKAELIAEIERARRQASANRQGLQGTSARVSRKAEANVSRHRYGWMLGAILAGFVVAKLPARTKKVVVNRRGEQVNGSLENAGKAGFALAILKVLIDITKPIIMAWATKRLGEAVHIGKQVRQKVDKVERRTS